MQSIRFNLKYLFLLTSIAAVGLATFLMPGSILLPHCLVTAGRSLALPLLFVGRGRAGIDPWFLQSGEKFRNPSWSRCEHSVFCFMLVVGSRLRLRFNSSLCAKHNFHVGLQNCNGVDLPGLGVISRMWGLLKASNPVAPTH